MRFPVSISVALLIVTALGAAPAPEGEGPLVPSVRLIYESDTRAYYRPCG